MELPECMPGGSQGSTVHAEGRELTPAGHVGRCCLPTTPLSQQNPLPVYVELSGLGLVGVPGTRSYPLLQLAPVPESPGVLWYLGCCPASWVWLLEGWVVTIPAEVQLIIGGPQRALQPSWLSWLPPSSMPRAGARSQGEWLHLQRCENRAKS